MNQFFIRHSFRLALLIALGLSLLLVDFFSKAYIYHLLPLKESCPAAGCMGIPIFHNFLGIDFIITLALNKGAAWGLFSTFQLPLLILRLSVILALFLYLFFFNKVPSATMPLIFIITGALGNVIDYFLYGFVVDFLLFNLWGYHFPIFNFADICITIGVGWLLLNGLLQRKKGYA